MNYLMFCLKNAAAKIAILLGSLAFFFLSSTFVFAAPPATGTVQPSSGSSIPNQAITFQSTISHPDGYGHVYYVFLDFESESINPSYFAVCYDLLFNKFYLRNETNTEWLGGYAPGTNAIIENSYGILDCSKSFVSGSGNTLTVYWNISFKAKFVEAYEKNIYLSVTDLNHASTGWQWKGSWVVKNLGKFPPEIGSVTPVNGISKPNEAVTFTTTFIDRDGWENLEYVNLTFTTGDFFTNITASYFLNSNTLTFLFADVIEHYRPGSKNIIESPLVKLDCSKTTVSGSGNTLTINWNLTFKNESADNKIREIVISADDKDNLRTSQVSKGVWLIGENFTPFLDNIIPIGTSGMKSTEPDVPVTFFTWFSDPNGSKDIKEAALLINTTPDAKKCFYAYYDHQNNKFYLKNDSGTGWLGGFPPESNNTIENSFAMLDCSKSTILDIDNEIMIVWLVTFKPAFSGTKNIYTSVKDTFGAYEDWQNKGVWIINYPPRITSFLPAHRSIVAVGAPLRISASVFDPDNDDISYKYFLDGKVISDWSSLTEYSLPMEIKDKGRHNIKVEVKDANEGSASSNSDIFVCRDFPKPPEN